MSQYFVENPDILTNERELVLNDFGHSFKFLSNNGLFSCDKVDDASLILIKNIPEIKGDLLDLGCGYGVIGIVLATLNDVSLTFSDVNKYALEYAVKNASRNDVEVFNALYSDGFENIDGFFDVITLNPPIHAGKDVVYRLFKGASEHLKSSGVFYVVMYKKHGAESSLLKLREIFGHVETVFKKKSCFVFKAFL